MLSDFYFADLREAGVKTMTTGNRKATTQQRHNHCIRPIRLVQRNLCRIHNQLQPT